MLLLIPKPDFSKAMFRLPAYPLAAKASVSVLFAVGFATNFRIAIGFGTRPSDHLDTWALIIIVVLYVVILAVWEWLAPERKEEAPGVAICVGRPMIEILANEGAWTSTNGHSLIAADSLFRQNPYEEKAPGGAGEIVEQLAERLVWVAPVGIGVTSHEKWNKPELLGFMVCRRVMNNRDGPNTKVEFLRVDPTQSTKWKKPFRQCEHMFPTLVAAYAAAAEAMNLPAAPPIPATEN